MVKVDRKIKAYCLRHFLLSPLPPQSAGGPLKLGHTNSNVSSSLIRIFSSDVLLFGIAGIFRLKFRAFFFSFEKEKRLGEVLFETKVLGCVAKGFLQVEEWDSLPMCACAVYPEYDIANNSE